MVSSSGRMGDGGGSLSTDLGFWNDVSVVFVVSVRERREIERGRHVILSFPLFFAWFLVRDMELFYWGIF